MGKATTILYFFVFCSTVIPSRSCDDHTDHDHSKRALPSAHLTPPTRDLEWGDVNIIHTTDTHGWLLGHQEPSLPEPNYSGDFGDLASFVTHMKQIALDRDVDLLLVDSGTGLSDGFPPGGIDGHEASATFRHIKPSNLWTHRQSNQFLAKLPYDVMAIGNHELEVYANTLDMHTNFAPQLKGRYLTSNVNITVADNKGNAVSVPVGNRFAKFRTRKGRRVTAFGVLFSFTGNVKNTTVQKVADMVKETWFLDAIREEPDFFLLAGHMPVQRDDWPFVFKAIRAVHPTTPILILGGHSHIRDCVQLDSRSMALESGRFMETVGWMSMKLPRHKSDNMTFSRRYLDPNRVTYEFHTRHVTRHLDTPFGERITKGLLALAKRFDLGFTFGIAPHDFTLSRFFIANAESQRFDIYAGPFTKDDQFTASPFADRFLFVPGIPASAVSKILPVMNGEGDLRRRSAEELDRREKELYASGNIDARFKRWLEAMDQRSGEERRAHGNLTLGYVTSDSCPGVGDDTPHAPMPFFSAPEFIGSNVPNATSDALVDVVFLDFIQNTVLGALNSVQQDRNFSASDVQLYSNLTADQVLGVYAQLMWN
ncbi:hypothetical protein CCMSSC00406_0009439 [Pleurotus cornucopiae]|uniref:Uncharacterized protein n=1 Tax=Pleurotus cornucopiae TaxID=5321 RepID=A0ACB7IUL9_PLECO|nr:hypothetical protein CCMSSC00406_0009439 [Pleurotus cornucopiae]